MMCVGYIRCIPQMYRCVCKIFCGIATEEILNKIGVRFQHNIYVECFRQENTVPIPRMAGHLIMLGIQANILFVEN